MIEDFPSKPVARGGIRYHVRTDLTPLSPRWTRRDQARFRARMAVARVRRWIHDRTAD